MTNYLVSATWTISEIGNRFSKTGIISVTASNALDAIANAVEKSGDAMCTCYEVVRWSEGDPPASFRFNYEDAGMYARSETSISGDEPPPGKFADPAVLQSEFELQVDCGPSSTTYPRSELREPSPPSVDQCPVCGSIFRSVRRLLDGTRCRSEWHAQVDVVTTSGGIITVDGEAYARRPSPTARWSVAKEDWDA